MNFQTIFRWAAFSFLLFCWGKGVSQDVPEAPNPPRLVNDFSMMLSQTEKAMLEGKLRRYHDSTSTQIVIVTVKTVQPYTMEDYALVVGRKWGVGQKGKSNGLIILWATSDRKVFIATGYGMEARITDGIARRITSQIIAPKFKQNLYYQGLNDGIDYIIQRNKGEFRSEEKGNPGTNRTIFLILFLILFILILRAIFRNGGGSGGLRGVGGSPFIFFSGGGSDFGRDGDSGSFFGGFGGGDFGGGGAGSDY